jgi:hypothetical protein
MRLHELPNRLIGDVETHGLEHRCYNGICLFAGLGILLSSLFNVLIGIHWFISLVSLFIASTYLFLYARSRRHPDFQPYYGIFVVNGVVLLAATWLWNGGLDGSAPMVALVALVALITAVNRNPFRVVGMVFVPLMSILFLIEYLAPFLVQPYASRGERFLDLYVTFLLATFVVAQIILMILKAYREERARADAINQRLSENLEALQQTNRNLEKALSEVKTLSGLLPICASCQKIRNDRGYWDRIETYIQAHSEATFSHSLCPDCAHRLYPDIYPETDAVEGVTELQTPITGDEET